MNTRIFLLAALLLFAPSLSRAQTQPFQLIGTGAALGAIQGILTSLQQGRLTITQASGQLAGLFPNLPTNVNDLGRVLTALPATLQLDQSVAFVVGYFNTLAGAGLTLLPGIVAALPRAAQDITNAAAVLARLNPNDPVAALSLLTGPSGLLPAGAIQTILVTGVLNELLPLGFGPPQLNTVAAALPVVAANLAAGNTAGAVTAINNVVSALGGITAIGDLLQGQAGLPGVPIVGPFLTALERLVVPTGTPAPRTLTDVINLGGALLDRALPGEGNLGGQTAAAILNPANGGNLAANVVPLIAPVLNAAVGAIGGALNLPAAQIPALGNVVNAILNPPTQLPVPLPARVQEGLTNIRNVIDRGLSDPFTG